MTAKNLIEDILVFFDLETSGLSPTKDRIIEIAAIKLYGKTELGRFHSLVNPEQKLSLGNSAIHGITNEMLENAPTFLTIAPKFIEFIRGAKLVAHNARFDLAFLQESLVRNNFQIWEGKVFDSMKLFKILYPNLPSYSLEALLDYFRINYDSRERHRAMNDVENTVALFMKILDPCKN